MRSRDGAPYFPFRSEYALFGNRRDPMDSSTLEAFGAAARGAARALAREGRTCSGSDQQLVGYTAVPGSHFERAIAELAALGLRKINTAR